MTRQALRGLQVLWLALLTAPVSAQSDPVPAASSLWSITSEPCVGMHTDGEPWEECGFEAHAMTADGGRVLTVSFNGRVQLWDGAGREIRRIDWADESGGASGYPASRVAIVGGIGVAIAHHNQLLLVDLTDGREILRRTLDLMTIAEMRGVGERLFLEVRRRDWAHGTAELDLATGALRDLDEPNLMRVGPTYWVTGGVRDSVLHRIGAADLPLERSCMPVDARYCTWRDIPGHTIHVLDVPAGRWSRLDYDRELDTYTMSQVAAAGDHVLVTVCWLQRSSQGRYDCTIRDLATGAEIHRLETPLPRTFGGLDAEGRPELRLWRSTRPGEAEQLRIGLDGVERPIDGAGRALLGAPGGGMILPDEHAERALLVDPTGRTVARLPFNLQTCGVAWTGWSGGCAVSAGGRRWLVPTVSQQMHNGRDVFQRGLTLYDVPAPR